VVERDGSLGVVHRNHQLASGYDGPTRLVALAIFRRFEVGALSSGANSRLGAFLTGNGPVAPNHLRSGPFLAGPVRLGRLERNGVTDITSGLPVDV